MLMAFRGACTENPFFSIVVQVFHAQVLKVSRVSALLKISHPPTAIYPSGRFRIFEAREIKNEMLKLIEIISASPSVYAYGEPNHRPTNDLKEEDDGLQYAINDKSYPTVIQLGKMLRSQAGLALSGDGDNRAKESEHDLAPNASEGEEEEEEAEPKEDDDASHESQSVVSSTSLVSVQQEATSWAKAIQQALIKKN